MAAKLSLVVCTIGRVEELFRLFASLKAQTYNDFEVLLMDQNKDDRLAPLLATYDGAFPLRHLRCAAGLSRARNVALKQPLGQFVAFPDDDCWYPTTDLLSKIIDFLERRDDVDILTGSSVDQNGDYSSLPWDSEAGAVNKENVWRRGISYSIFIKRRVVEAVSTFDLNLGVGSGTKFQSGDETDYLLRVIEAGFNVYYNPEFRVGHPEKKYIVDNKRAFGYGAGLGCVMRRHRYGPLSLAVVLIRPLGGACLYFLRGRLNEAEYQYQSLMGRLYGYWRGGFPIK